MTDAVCPRCYTRVSRQALTCEKCGHTWMVSQATIDIVEEIQKYTYPEPGTLTDAEKLAKIRKLHSPGTPPEGMTWMGSAPGEQAVPCEGCATGDPYLDPAWPCKTREICDE